MDETNEITTKKCTKCDEVKALDQFNADKRRKDGKQYSCKVCQRRYRQENKERLAEKKRKYHEENKERLYAGKRKWYEENKKRIAEKSRKYAQENKERLAEYKRKYRKENKERIAEGMRKYRQENPETDRRAKRKRRALKRNLPHAPLTPAQYERLYEFRDQVFGEVTS